MALGLDLGPSRAKLHRAAEHLRTLDGQLPIIVDHDPVSFRVTEVDPDTGWCDVFGRLNEAEEPTLSVIAGDYVHNLRSALDYIVTALVEADGVDLRDQHQFPIHEDSARYKSKVGTRRAVKGGPLHGVTHGLALIDKFQPYHDQPNAHRHPLAYLNRFSNTDKHRQLLKLVGWFPENYVPDLNVSFVGTCVERWQVPVFELSLSDETKIAAFRFAKPYPAQVRVDGDLKIQPMMASPPFPPRYPLGAMLSMEVLKGIYTCVASAVSQAEAL